MKILRVFDRYSDSGLNYFLIERILQLNSREFEMSVAYLDKLSGDVPAEYGGVPFYLLSEKRVRSLSLPVVFELVKLIKKENIDILHCDNYKGIFYGVLASLFCKNVKVMCLMHGLNRCRNWKRRMFFRIFAHKIDKFLGCSERVCDDIKKYPGVDSGKVKVLKNSVNYEKFKTASRDSALRQSFGFDDNDFVFINVGRLVETKGLQYLLEAFENLAGKSSNAKLLIVGDGRLRADLEDKSPQGVVFAGFRKDVAQLMSVSDCFVLSSIREGMPLVVFEAMSVGLPVVTTDTGAAEQVIGEDGQEYGFLCPVADSKALEKEMERAIKMTSDQRKELVSKAKKRIEDNFTHSVAVENLKRLYTDVYSS
ncbi:MAG: glycosyltransferase [Sedimentisphaeraceae bacterium JB056]